VELGWSAILQEFRFVIWITHEVKKLLLDDALAKSIRKKLRARGVNSGIKVVYSNERTSMGLMPLKDHQK